MLRALVVAQSLIGTAFPATIARTWSDDVDLRWPEPAPLQTAQANPSTDCPRIQARGGPPFAFTWSTQSVSATFPWKIGARAEPVSVRLRYERKPLWPPQEPVESTPVQLPASVGWDPVQLRLSGLLPGTTYGVQLRVTDSRGSCDYGYPGWQVPDVTTPTGRWTRSDPRFGIDRFAGVLADFDGDGGADFLTVPLASAPTWFSVGIALQGPDPATNDMIRIVARPGHYRRLFFELDFSGDGRPDVLFAETGVDPLKPTSLVGRLNEGQGGFRVLSETPIPDPQGFWKALDVDGDGRDDVLEIGRSDGAATGSNSRWYRSRGDGAFDARAATGLPAPMTPSEGAAWTGDADGDGLLDLLITGEPGPGAVTRVYRNLGTGSFVPIPGPFESWRVLSAAWADLDGDGRAELALCGLVTSNSPAFGLFRRTNGGGFVEWGEGWPRDVQAWVGAGDLDADGNADLVLAGPDGGWWRNLGSGRFVRMPDPMNLDSTFGTPAPNAKAWVRDMDGDDDLDVFVDAGWNQVLFRNDMLSARPRVRAGRVSEPAGGPSLVLRLSGELGQEFRISSSPDLSTWSQEDPVVIRTGSLDVAYSVEPGRAERFFRARPAP